MMYETVETWLTVITDSTATRKSYSYHTSKFFEMFNLNPDKLIEKWKDIKYSMRTDLKERFLDDIRGYLDQLKVKCKKKGYAEKTIATKIAAICSFFNYYRIDVDYGIKSGQVTYHNRSIKKEEIKDILEQCSLRDKVFFKMMQESGLRPHTLARLRYKHIKDDYEKGKVPMYIDTPSNIVKGNSVSGRFTFIGSEAFNLLQQ